eukprot:s2641_g8.t1
MRRFQYVRGTEKLWQSRVMQDVRKTVMNVTSCNAKGATGRTLAWLGRLQVIDELAVARSANSLLEAVQTLRFLSSETRLPELQNSCRRGLQQICDLTTSIEYRSRCAEVPPSAPTLTAELFVGSDVATGSPRDGMLEDVPSPVASPDSVGNPQEVEAPATSPTSVAENVEPQLAPVEKLLGRECDQEEQDRFYDLLLAAVLPLLGDGTSLAAEQAVVLLRKGGLSEAQQEMVANASPLGCEEVLDGEDLRRVLESMEQLAGLLDRINQQAEELASLRLRVSQLEQRRESEFEVVSSAPAASPRAPASLILSSSGISEERREIAKNIGKWLKRCAEGEIRGPSGRDQINLASEDCDCGCWTGLPCCSAAVMASGPPSEGVPECPERSGPRDNFVLSGDRVIFDYSTGYLQLDADSALCSLIAVTEVDGGVLVAVPEQVWDRTKAKRILPPDSLRRAVRVMVPGSIDEDRTTPESSPSFKIWLGVLKETYEAYVYFGEDDIVDVAYGFPADSLGLSKLPFAKALVAIAKDHFEFATAAEDPPAVRSSPEVEQRMQALEEGMKQLQASLEKFHGGGAAPDAGRRAPSVARAPGRSRGAPEAAGEHQALRGIDPGLARQAKLSGVSEAALGEFAQMLGGTALRPGSAVPRVAPQRKQAISEDEDEDLDGEELPDAAGSDNPMERAVLQLSKIVSHLNAEKKTKKDKTLEALLDRAESGGAPGLDGLSSSSRSKPAALRSLKKLLVQRPELIQVLGAEDGGGLDTDRDSPWCNFDQHHRAGMAGTSVEDTKLPGPGEGCLVPCWSVGRPEGGKHRPSQSKMCFGRCILRSTRDRQRVLVGRLRSSARGSSTFLLVCSSSASGGGREPTHQVDRRAMAGVVSCKAQRCFRVPGEALQTDSGQQATGRELLGQREGQGQSSTKEEAEGRWKGWKLKGRGRGQGSPTGLKSVTMNPPGVSRSTQCAGLEDDLKEALHVPGAKAPVCDISRFWSSMARWMLRSEGSLSSFFRSIIGRLPSTSEGSAPSPWPMPLPYPRWMSPGKCDVLGQSGYRKMVVQKAVNYIILVLSWLHLNRPAVAPACLHLQAKLDKRQWAIVHRFERLLVAAAETDAVGPSEMGRTAAKVESLDSLLENLHGQARKLISDNYMKPLPEAQFLKVGTAPAAGQVIGSVKVGNPSVAKEVEPKRLSVPVDPPEFQPDDLLPSHHRQVFRNPLSFATDPSLSSIVPPRVQLHASRSQAFELLHFLDQRHRLVLAPEKKVRPSHLCGVFSLIKDQSKDRMILDARPPNLLEEALNEWTATLGSVAALVQIELRPGHQLLMSGTDLCDYYYCYKVSRERAYRNALNFPLSPQQASALQCFDQTMTQHPKLYPCLSTLAMGDNQAVELGQCAHVNLGFQAGAFSTHELLTVHGRAPRGAIACGVVIDDVLIAEQVPVSLEPSYTEGERRLDKLCEEYLQRGLRPHPTKTFRKVDKTEVWGAAINGKTGLVQAAPKRLIPLMWITARVALLGVATVGLLQVLSGSWISILQVRRRMLCLLDHLYAAQQGRDQAALVELSPELKSELWSLCALGPIAVADLKAASHPELFLSDASEEFTASVRTEITGEFCRELQRHCLARGAWGKLLSPWQSWLKSHEALADDEELPSGVPLVSHPLWLELAETMQFRHHHRKPCQTKKHINILELQSILEVEERLAQRHQDCRYVLGADSQVALAVIVKGRSSSAALNTLLRKSLPNVLGHGLYGSYGFIPSLANVADDPTRSVRIREPRRLPVFDLRASLDGCFHSLDAWLGRIGFTPEEVARIPTATSVIPKMQDVQRLLLDPLRAVQKPERLQVFDAKYGWAVSLEQPSEEISRELEQESDDQTKNNEKSPEKFREQEGPNQAVSLFPRHVAPHASKGKVVVDTSPCGLPRVRRPRQNHGSVVEDPRLPELSEAARQLLAQIPHQQFLLPGGKRAGPGFVPSRRGMLDLYSGEAGVAKALTKTFSTWVLTFDFCHGEGQDLLDTGVQDQIFSLLRADAFWGVGAAPECASFSRAVNPPVRSRNLPDGLPGISMAMAVKVEKGNRHAAFVLKVILEALARDLAYWVENPDGSFLWLLRAWLESGVCRFDRSYRFDMCRYGTRWRKRTRICTNTQLAGMRELCIGGHSHLQLRGRSTLHQMSWTRVAQVYPRSLCSRLARALAGHLGLKAKSSRRFSPAACARCQHNRIGEAANPGPRRPPTFATRDVSDLLDTQLYETSTLIIQNRVWMKFNRWVSEQFSEETVNQIFLCPLIASQVLRKFGLHCYESGAALYELRHLLVSAGQRFPMLKPVLGPAWDVLARWEEINPVVHRIPLPETLFRAMFAMGVFKGWYRWSATLLLGYEGIARIGEVLAALRRDLVLPSDLFDCDYTAAFLRVRKPKSRRRGKGRVQHLKIERAEVVGFLDAVFCELDAFLPLFPLSASVFRARWDKLLISLGVPKVSRPTPASIRGGGAIAAYRRGESIQSILWRMRLVAQSTLESYLQELAAESFLLQLPEVTAFLRLDGQLQLFNKHEYKTEKMPRGASRGGFQGSRASPGKAAAFAWARVSMPDMAAMAMANQRKIVSKKHSSRALQPQGRQWPANLYIAKVGPKVRDPQSWLRWRAKHEDFLGRFLKLAICFPTFFGSEVSQGLRVKGLPGIRITKVMVDELHSSEDSAWVQDDVERICTETLDLHLKEHQFNEEMVPHWINEICESIMARLNEQKKPFKYVVSCIIMQRNGAGLHTATSCWWDAGNDGVYTYVWPREKSKDVVNKSMYCIVTVFGLEF